MKRTMRMETFNQLWLAVYSPGLQEIPNLGASLGIDTPGYSKNSIVPLRAIVIGDVGGEDCFDMKELLVKTISLYKAVKLCKDILELDIGVIVSDEAIQEWDRFEEIVDAEDFDEIDEQTSIKRQLAMLNEDGQMLRQALLDEEYDKVVQWLREHSEEVIPTKESF